MTSIAKVMGANARALRLGANVTAERFAAAAQSMGLPWNTGRVGQFEFGRIQSADLPTVYAAAAALGQVIGRPVSLTELLATDEPVDINDKLTLAPAALCGEIVPVPVSGSLGAGGQLTGKAAPILETDHRACEDIPVDREVGVAAMIRLWGHPLSAERDHRAGEDANAQRRGIISRQLRSELRKELGV